MTAFAELPGAVALDGRAPLRYGNPIAEQRVLVDGAEVLLDRGVLKLSGPDRLSWLDSITTQSIAGLGAGESAETLVLSPNGRIEHWLRLADDGTSTWIILDPAEVEPLAAWLLRMRFMMRVEIEDVTEQFDVIGSTGPERDGVVWRDAWPSVLDGGVRYGDRVEWWQWHETIVPAGAGPLDEQRVAGTIAFEALRIAAGRPSMLDVDDHAIPHELDWLATAVHLTKGCYRGQETIAKVHNLGAPPRRLTLLHLDGSESTLPQPGDTVVMPSVDGTAGRDAGVITAAAQHYELGPIALAMLKRSVDPAVDLVVNASDPTSPFDPASDAPDEPTRSTTTVLVAARQEVLVPPSAGHANKPPRMPRLGAVKRPAR